MTFLLKEHYQSGILTHATERKLHEGHPLQASARRTHRSHRPRRRLEAVPLRCRRPTGRNRGATVRGVAQPGALRERQQPAVTGAAE